MTDKKMSEHFEQIYRGSRPDEIPWNCEQPPELLVELVESRQVKPGRALDLGCGLGNYAIWLASKGFDVVGIDASPTAIKTAKRNAKEKGVKCKLLVGDVTGHWPDLGGQLASAERGEAGFDFVYDWGLLHHIPPRQRPGYVENVHKVLKQQGKYASLCFNEKDTAFAGTGKVRNTQLGTVVYLSSEDELRKLFERFFRIIDFRVLEITGKIMAHIFNFAFMERKGE